MTRKRICALVLTLALALTAMALPAAAADVDDEDTEATVTFTPDTSGPGGASLYMDNVPTLDFGSHTVSASDATYAATGASDKLLRVVDNRGTSIGWRVTAEITDDFTGQSNSAPLSGSRITITGGTVSYGATSSSPPPAPAQAGSITLNNSGGPALVLLAAKDHGNGAWNDTLDTVNLEVPGGSALADAYKATITWTLSDAPA